MDIMNIRDNPTFINQASEWFSSKWGVPVDSYKESMAECIDYPRSQTQWYVVRMKGKIIAGAGVIENDFHNRKDLTPNLCALYVEESHRSKGIAGKILNHIVNDMNDLGFTTLYLITDHTTFYEKYDWVYYCAVQEEETNDSVRMYRHDTP